MDDTFKYWFDAVEVEEDVYVSQTTGAVLTYFNWNPGQPDTATSQDCLVISAQGDWLDAPCSNLTSFTSPAVCQSESKNVSCLVINSV